MSANSLNRYSPVPPIAAKQPPDKKKMSSSTTEKRQSSQSQSSDLCVSGSSGLVSKAPTIKRASVTAGTTAAGGTVKQDSDAKENRSQVEAQCNGEAKKAAAAATDVVDDALVLRQDESAVMTNDKDASSTVYDTDTAATDADDHDGNADNDNDDIDQSDDEESSTSVSFNLAVVI